jgi:ketosteroid isomerase-like protein
MVDGGSDEECGVRGLVLRRGCDRLPPGEPVAIGREPAKKVWAAYFADSTYTISWQTEHAGVAQSGELGFTAGTCEDSYMGPDGTPVTEKGKSLCTWAKQPDGSWKATHDMWNQDSR